MTTHQDWTDEAFVTGAVWAQLEDIDNKTAIRILQEIAYTLEEIEDA
jgi:hypothetical protein